MGAGSVLWLFGDGATASDSAAVHDYAQPGSFNIALIVDPGTACADTAVVSVVVGNGPSAAFAVTLLCDLVVEFADASTPGSTLLWTQTMGPAEVLHLNRIRMRTQVPSWSN